MHISLLGGTTRSSFNHGASVSRRFVKHFRRLAFTLRFVSKGLTSMWQSMQNLYIQRVFLLLARHEHSAQTA